MNDRSVPIDPAFSAIRGGVTQGIEHDSARKHVTGQAVYVDDMPEPRNLLHVQLGLSSRAHARIKSLDLNAVMSAPGVVHVFTAADVKGTNDFGHGGNGDDRVFAEDIVEYHGQAVFAVAAESFSAARAAARLAEIRYEDLVPVLTIDDALEKESYICPPLTLEQGDAVSALELARHRLSGRIHTGGQEHFYLEPQVSMALPGEDGDVRIHCATQDPGAVQHLVARVLDKPAHDVTVEVRRMGGAFGGKETVATHFAAVAALVTDKTGRPAKCRLDRDDDMAMTGKRHGFRFDYDVGFDDDGTIRGITMRVASHAGYSEDQSPAILQRAMYHCDGAYFLENATILGFACKTNTCTGCAFRGFGSPQALLAIERVMDEISFYLGKDPLDVRKTNLYGETERNTTPYGWKIRDNVLPRMLQDLESSAEYKNRRESIRNFNASSKWIKKGFALMPLKYSVGFTATFLNQAGALIHIYQDGSIHLNHGGTEMGQGLFQKVAQVVAQEFQVDISEVKITSTVTDKIPNTTATAASSGSDMNGAAAQKAARTIKQRLIDFAAQSHDADPAQVVFCKGRVKSDRFDVSFKDLVKDAYMNLVSLSATGFYSNPYIGVHARTLKGRPYHYSAYGVAAVEVAIDMLTGESRMLRFDLLHDVGNSLNPGIDMGQLEGGFVQGMGWLTSEELVWDTEGKLQTHAPSTYKIPVCSDCPEDFRMRLVDWNSNVEKTVFRSKAIGEPPFNLAVSVFNAITDAVASVAEYRYCPNLNAPATPEEILRAVRKMRRLMRSNASQDQTNAA